VDLVSCSQYPLMIQNIRRGQSLLGSLPNTFSLDPMPAFPIEIQPGGRYRLNVRYTPMLSQPEMGFYQVLSNDMQNPDQRLDLSAWAMPPELQDVALHVRLEWNTDLTDVDLHLLGPDGVMWTCEGDCYFSNMNPDWGQPNHYLDDPFLDTDDVDGFGPENINLEEPIAGTYRVLIHYYDHHDGDDPDATVEVLNFGNVVASYGPVRLSAVNDTWEVVDIEYPAFTLTPLGGIIRPPGGNCIAF